MLNNPRAVRKSYKIFSLFLRVLGFFLQPFYINGNQFKTFLYVLQSVSLDSFRVEIILNYQVKNDVSQVVFKAKLLRNLYLTAIKIMKRISLFQDLGLVHVLPLATKFQPTDRTMLNRI